MRPFRVRRLDQLRVNLIASSGYQKGNITDRHILNDSPVSISERRWIGRKEVNEAAG